MIDAINMFKVSKLREFKVIVYEYKFKKKRRVLYKYFSLEQMTDGTAVDKVKSFIKKGWIKDTIKMINYVNVGVSIMIENEKGQLLMGQRSRENSHGVRTWCTPGGHIEFGESLEKTCKREVFEEVGIKVKDVIFIGITNDVFKKENKHYVTLFFKATYSSGTVKSSAELNNVGWFDKNKLPKPLFLCMKNYLKSDFCL